MSKKLFSRVFTSLFALAALLCGVVFLLNKVLVHPKDETPQTEPSPTAQQPNPLQLDTQWEQNHNLQGKMKAISYWEKHPLKFRHVRLDSSLASSIISPDDLKELKDQAKPSSKLVVTEIKTNENGNFLRLAFYRDPTTKGCFLRIQPVYPTVESEPDNYPVKVATKYCKKAYK